MFLSNKCIVFFVCNFFSKSLDSMHILLNETECLNEALMKDIFNISAYLLGNLL